MSVPEGAVEALAVVLAGEALFEADIEGYGWDAETDSIDHFLPYARRRAKEYLEVVSEYLVDKVDVEESCPVHLMDGRNEIRCWYPKGHEGKCR